MIVVDTSALLTIVYAEPLADRCDAALKAAPKVLISAGTLTEALIVSGARGVRGDLERLVEAYRIEVVPVTAASARRAAEAHTEWGKGVNGLNFGDCFAYEVAKENDCRLLYVGRDFARTDVKSALSAGAGR